MASAEGRGPLTRHRRCIVLRGGPDATRAEADALVRALPAEHVLWVGPETRLRDHLGRGYDAVVIDLHGGLDPDALGRCHGLVWGGGALILRLPDAAPPGPEHLAVWPYRADDVGTRLWGRFERFLATSEAVAPAAPVAPVPHAVGGTDDQRRAVEALVALFAGPPALATLTADRGRGKSAALGLALRQAGFSAIVTSGSPAAADEVRRFAPDVPFLAPSEAVRAEVGVLVVDEAAQLPVPLLQRLVRAHPGARIAFASTTRGYEGTGRGFVLRFLDWLATEGRPVTRLDLRTPIRWDEGDPLERFAYAALALDAEPAPDEVFAGLDPDRLDAVALDRDALAGDEPLLRDLFGLLVHAHYRTTPGDLQRLLDAPNLAVHALLHRGRVAAASLVAREGGLPPDRCEDLARGRGRIRGHALPDTLISHAGRTEAGGLAIIRSVRVAVHPALRRRGLARRLVAHVHASYDPDLFGTVFGATPEVLRFRRDVGYALVRVGVSRGERTGEPAAVMLGPVSDAARALVRRMQADLARDLPLQLALLEADEPLDPRLAAALQVDLPAPSDLADDERRAIVDAYLHGPRLYDQAALAITRSVEARLDRLDALEPRARALVTGRVLERRGWADLTRDLGLGTPPATMRALRRALRELLAG